MTHDQVAEALAPHHLAIMGSFDALPDDSLPHGTCSVALIGPHEPGFWAHVNAAPEFLDDAPDPLDRWSTRVIGDLAKAIGASALFPFGGPPWHPFIGWATRTGRIWTSPVGLLVHDVAGLFVSFRGALALPFPIDHAAAPCPCTDCHQPCLDACPVGALTKDGYDVPACRDFLSTADGSNCLSQGCNLRRACPVSQTYGRRPAQSAFHMEAFAQ